MAIGSYKAFTGEMPQRSGTRLGNSIELKKLRFERDKGRKPTGSEVVAMMKEGFQKVDADYMGADRVARAAETQRNIESQGMDAELDLKDEMRSPAYLKEQSQRRAEDRETDRTNYARGLRKQFTQSGRREDKANPLDKDEGAFQGFLNKYGTPGMRSDAEVERQLLERQEAERNELRIGGENKAAMERDLDPRLAEGARIAKDKARQMRERDARIYQESPLDTAMDSETLSDLVEGEASDKQFAKDKILEQIDQEYDKRTIGTVMGDDPKYKRRGQEGIPLSELEADQEGRIQNKRERLKSELDILGMGDPNDPAETGHMRNERLPGLHEKQRGETKEDTEMNEQDRIAQERMEREAMARRQGEFHPGEFRKSPEQLISEDQANIEQEMAEGEAIDVEERNVNEEFTTPDQAPDLRNMSKEEKKEVIEQVAKTAPNGRQDEGYLAAKEATGDYVRYGGSGFVINKRKLDDAFDRQEKMAMLQHIPQANRAAMLFNWKFIDQEDLDTAQQQSAKQIKEQSLLDLRIAEVKQKMDKSSNTLSKTDQVQYTSHSAGFRQAVKDGDWETAEYFHNKMNSVLPSGSKQEVDFAGLMKKQQEKLRKMTPMKVFQAAGLKDGTAYYKSVDGIMKMVNDIKKSDNKGNSWDQILGQTMPTQTGEGSGTYGEFLKAQGIYSWKDIDAGKITSKQLASMPGITEDDLVSEEAYMSWALPKIQNKLATGIWGSVHTQIQNSLGLLKDETLANAQETINNPGVVEAEDAPKPKPKPIVKKKPKKKVEPEVKAEGPEIFKKEGYSQRERAQLKIPKRESSVGKKKYEDTNKTIKKMEKQLEEMRPSYSASEIKKVQGQINKMKKAAKGWKKKWDDGVAKLKTVEDQIQLRRELRSHNKKRAKRGLRWLRISEYQKMKKEGKIK